MGESEQKETVPKSLLKTDELYQYILETSVYPREPQPLKELREATDAKPDFIMSTSPVAGQSVEMLLKLINAKKTIEIGVFTGYSLLLTALSIPDDGKIIAIDVDRKNYDEIGLPIIKRAGVEHKINFIESQALPVLDKLLEDDENEGSWDFAYVDADKENNKNYHERLLKLLKVGGVVVYDNTLWGGSVAMREEDLGQLTDWLEEDRTVVREEIIKFNKALAADSRIQICVSPVGDGITICRRLY